MQIKSVHLKNFRNHADTFVELGAGLNVFVGQNAQGKTNLLESIYIACIGRGFKSARDRDIIRIGQDRATTKVTCAPEGSATKTTIEVLVSTQPGKSGKQITINNIPIAKMGQLIGTKTCIFFCPDELKLVKESPQDRRRFMDIDISQIDRKYFYALMRYNKTLKQRNALLKSLNPSDDMRGLDIWDEQLAEAGSYIISRRILFCEELKTSVAHAHKALSGGENLTLEYEHACPFAAPSGETQNSESQTVLLSAIRGARANDLRLRTTTVGPHRDDIKFTLGSLDARTFASQGQQRTIALAVKLAELELFKKSTNSAPILLLDDVFSELDTDRQTRLLALTKGTQTVITTNSFSHAVPSGAKIFKVSGGKITK